MGLNVSITMALFFTDEAVSIYQKVLGYKCSRLPLTELEDWVKELKLRYMLAKQQ